jgi:hypothetical protein
MGKSPKLIVIKRAGITKNLTSLIFDMFWRVHRLAIVTFFMYLVMLSILFPQTILLGKQPRCIFILTPHQIGL